MEPLSVVLSTYGVLGADRGVSAPSQDANLAEAWDKAVNDQRADNAIKTDDPDRLVSPKTPGVNQLIVESSGKIQGLYVKLNSLEQASKGSAGSYERLTAGGATFVEPRKVQPDQTNAAVDVMIKASEYAMYMSMVVALGMSAVSSIKRMQQG